MDPITQLIVGILLQLVVAGAKSLFAQAQDTPKAPNLRGEETRGGDESFSFIIGTYASAGHFNYHGSWGVSGGAPTAYYTEEVGFSDLKITGFTGAYIDQQVITLNQSTGLVDKGYPIAEKNDGTRDNLWLRTYIGDQTAADPLLLTKFATDPDRPYSADMIGKGVAKVVMTARTQREVFTGFPKLKMVCHGIPLYDITKDSTAGGTGSHRWGNQSTYEFSDYPSVIIYNLLRGIYDENSNLVYGGGYEAWQLPYAVFSAARAVCDQDIALLAGGTEKRFRVGADVRVGEVSPANLIKAILNNCSGRMSESRGMINLVIGPPGSPVASITDDDFEVVNNSQTADLLKGVNDTRNAMTGSYMAPEESWTKKQLPTLAPATYLAQDDGFVRSGSLDLKHTFSNTQGQRVVKAALMDNRRVRIHAGTLPPEFMGLQVYDTISWTSAREQYSAKTFEIIAIDDTPEAFQAVVLREVDGSDHDFMAGSDEQAVTYAPLTTTVPPSQAIVSWSALADAINDDSGQRRPAILLGWDNSFDNISDIKFVQVEVRLKSTQALVYEKYDIDPTKGSANLSSPAFLPLVEYEVRGRYDPRSNRRTSWSNWISVTMLNLKLTSDDIADYAIELTNLNQELQNQTQILMEELPTRINSILADIAYQATAAAQMQLTSKKQSELLYAQTQSASAAVIRESEVRVSENSAMASDILQVSSQLDGATADGLFSVQTQANVDGVSSTIAIAAKVSVDGDTSTSAMLLKAAYESGVLVSDIYFTADRLWITDGTNNSKFARFDGSGNLVLQTIRADKISSLDGTSFILDGTTGNFSVGG